MPIEPGASLAAVPFIRPIASLPEPWTAQLNRAEHDDKNRMVTVVDVNHSRDVYRT